MACICLSSLIFPLLLITLSSLSYNANLVGARHLLETTLPEIPTPKLPELPPLPKLDLPEIPKPTLPEIPKTELPQIPKPELPAFPHLPELPKPTLPTVPNLPKDFPEIPTHSTTHP